MKQEPGECQTQKAPAVDVERFESCDLEWHLFFIIIMYFVKTIYTYFITTIIIIFN
jgi:hypothetical protein